MEACHGKRGVFGALTRLIGAAFIAGLPPALNAV
jgi:hypothetical protein